MQHRVLTFSIALVLGLTPVFADTTTSGTSNMSVAPSNAQYVTPTTNQNASTANVSTQINNQNLGANSYGPGITCQSAQIALGGYGARQSSGVGTPDSDTGVTVQYLTPVGGQSTRTCQSLADEVVRQHQLDTQLTFIQKCADFARAGITLDPHIYPELARECAGIHLTPSVSGVTPNAYPRASGSYIAPATRLSYRPYHLRVHLSDFSPQHNSELQRIALHRAQRVAALRLALRSRILSSSQRETEAQHLRHENAHLLAVIAEYTAEHHFYQDLSSDSSWHANSDLRTRILSNDKGN